MVDLDGQMDQVDLPRDEALVVVGLALRMGHDRDDRREVSRADAPDMEVDQP